MIDYTVNNEDEGLEINGLDYFLNCIDDFDWKRL